MNRLLLLCCFFFALSIATYAQTATPSCAQTLRLAQSVYEQGRLHEIPGILESCLNGNKFTDQEKVSAYKILTNTYIYLEEPEQADESMLKLLQTDHYFQINEAVDPAEFVALYKTFRTTPIYRIGGKIGAISTTPNVVSSDETNDGVSSYKQKFAFTAAFSAEIPFLKKLILNPELYFQQNSFSQSNTYTANAGDFVLTSNQSHSYLSLPVSVQYQIMQNKFNPYVSAGVAADYLIGASMKLDRKRPGSQPIEENSVPILSQREKFNLSMIASAGIKVRLAGGFAVAEFRYKYGLLNINNKATAYDSSVSIWNYHYVDSIFKLNSISFTVGYVHNIFNPKKLSSK